MTQSLWTMIWRLEVVHHFVFHILNIVGLLGWILAEDPAVYLIILAANFLYSYIILLVILGHCPATMAENVLRSKAGLPPIKSFWGNYISGS